MRARRRGNLPVVKALAISCLLALAAAPAWAEPLDGIPASYPGVGWFGGSDAPILHYLRELQGLPACVDQQLATVDGYFQAVTIGAPSLIVFRGKLDRIKVDACIAEVLAKLPFGATMKHDGALTVLAGKTKSSYLGWSDDGSVFYGNKDQIDEALAHKTKLTSNKELMALVKRIDRSAAMWLVTAWDYTGKLLGVPSKGFIFDGKIQKQGAEVTAPFTIVFASPADAKRAAAAIAAAAKDKRFSAGLRDVIAKLVPATKGSDLTVNATPLVTHPELIAEMTTLVESMKK
jgi:hypothetical protein